MFDETRVYFCCAKVCGLLNDFLAIFSANRVVEVVWTSIRGGGDCHDQEESFNVTGIGRYKALHNEKVHGDTVY